MTEWPQKGARITSYTRGESSVTLEQVLETVQRSRPIKAVRFLHEVGHLKRCTKSFTITLHE